MQNIKSELMTRKQIAQAFQISLSTVIRMERSGLLPVVRLGLVASPRYRRADVEALIR